MAARAIREQEELLFIDAVLGVASFAIADFIQPLRGACIECIVCYTHHFVKFAADDLEQSFVLRESNDDVVDFVPFAPIQPS